MSKKASIITLSITFGTVAILAAIFIYLVRGGHGTGDPLKDALTAGGDNPTITLSDVYHDATKFAVVCPYETQAMITRDVGQNSGIAPSLDENLNRLVVVRDGGVTVHEFARAEVSLCTGPKGAGVIDGSQPLSFHRTAAGGWARDGVS